MNEQEANKKAQEMIAHSCGVFCPLIQATCQISCECYNMPEVYDTGHPFGYLVRHGFCTYYALKGDVP